MSGLAETDDGLLHGTIERPRFVSPSIAKGRAGTPSLREIPLYLPPEEGGDLPLVLYLSGFTGQGQDQLAGHPWHPKLAYRFDRAVRAGRLPGAILAFVDGFTALGGSQYVNSSYLGHFADYVAQEIPAFLASRYPIRSGAIAVMGKSSGGFGALHLALTQPKRFRCVAAISPDIGFPLAYSHELHHGLRVLAAHDHDPRRFLAAFRAAPKLDADSHAALTLLALSAAYSPHAEPAATPFEHYALPLTLDTAEPIEPVWQLWKRFDPLEAPPSELDHLRLLEVLLLDCGKRDEFNLHFGLRRFARRLTQAGIPHLHTEHPGGHFDLDERLLLALERILPAL